MADVTLSRSYRAAQAMRVFVNSTDRAVTLCRVTQNGSGRDYVELTPLEAHQLAAALIEEANKVNDGRFPNG